MGFCSASKLHDSSRSQAATSRILLGHEGPRRTPCGKHLDCVALFAGLKSCDDGFDLMFHLRVHHCFLAILHLQCPWPLPTHRQQPRQCDKRPSGHPGNAARTAVQTTSNPAPMCGGHDSGATDAPWTASALDHASSSQRRELDAFLQPGEKQPRSTCESLRDLVFS